MTDTEHTVGTQTPYCGELSWLSCDIKNTFLRLKRIRGKVPWTDMHDSPESIRKEGGRWVHFAEQFIFPFLKNSNLKNPRNMGTRVL